MPQHKKFCRGQCNDSNKGYSIDTMATNPLHLHPIRRCSYSGIRILNRRSARNLSSKRFFPERSDGLSRPTKHPSIGPITQRYDRVISGQDLCASRLRGISTMRDSRPFWTRGRLVFAGILTIAGIVYFMFPKHNYPKEVADLIRLGLKAERKDTSDSYERAISFYLAALEVAEHLDMDQTCDEYTGLQIKVGEILERLEAYDAALLMYNNILENGIVWLQEDPRRAGTMSSDKVIRYLRVSVRAAELAETMGRASANLPMLGMWIETLQKRLPDNYGRLLTTHVMDIEEDSDIPLVSYSIPRYPTAEEQTLFKHVDYNVEDTLTLARDYYATLLIENARPGIGYLLKNENIKLMQIMSIPLPRILRTQVDIASAYFICYERATAEEAVDAGDTRSVSPIPANNGPQYLELAAGCLKDAISLMMETRASSTKTKDYSEEDHQDLDIAQALATYGLGVIEAKKRNYKEAMDLLKEARIRAMGSQYPELVEKIKEEWSVMVEHMNKERVLDADAIAEAIEYLAPLTNSAR
ncbi:hypothetical protein V1509DRAFT_616475 [Lipomyces kononenkoae]